MSRSPYVGLHDIVASVQREISGGGLPAGSRLPPVRALEKQLGLSKNTAQAAYDELVARGLVEAREREGVFVLAANRTVTPTPIVRVPLPRRSRSGCPRAGSMSMPTTSSSRTSSSSSCADRAPAKEGPSP